jgi:branched-chain amino acid transport system permease protein
LTGLVYGLMALGLSVIFGVVRWSTRAWRDDDHGDVSRRYPVCGFSSDPLVMMIPIAATMFALGYLLQVGLINSFITRPEHSQFLLLIAIAIIIVNALLIVFGPDAQNVQVAYAYDSFKIGPLIVDATKVYAAAAAIVVAAALFAFFRYTAVGPALRACGGNYTGALVVGLDGHRVNALTFDWAVPLVPPAACLLFFDVTPAVGRLTLFAFVIYHRRHDRCQAWAGCWLLTEALAGLLFTPSAKSMFAFAILVVMLLFRPQGIMGKRTT